MPDISPAWARGTYPPSPGSSDAATSAFMPTGAQPETMPATWVPCPLRSPSALMFPGGAGGLRVVRADEEAEVAVQPRSQPFRQRHPAGLLSQFEGGKVRVAGVNPAVDDRPHDVAAAGVVGAPGGVGLDRGCGPVDLRMKGVVRPYLEDDRRLRAGPGAAQVFVHHVLHRRTGQDALVQAGRYEGEPRRNGHQAPGGRPLPASCRRPRAGTGPRGRRTCPGRWPGPQGTAH